LVESGSKGSGTGRSPLMVSRNEGGDSGDSYHKVGKSAPLKARCKGKGWVEQKNYKTVTAKAQREAWNASWRWGGDRRHNFKKRRCYLEVGQGRGGGGGN